MNSDNVLCPRTYTNARLRYAQSIAERVRARQHGILLQGRIKKFSKWYSFISHLSDY